MYGDFAKLGASLEQDDSAGLKILLKTQTTLLSQICGLGWRPRVSFKDGPKIALVRGPARL
jgi:hypothetical protein